MNKWHLFLAFFRVVMLGIMAIDFFRESYEGAGLVQMVCLAATSALLMFGKWRLHPAYVIALALVYGAVFLSP
ncbi:chromate transporter [Geobacillus stearothermophilus]|uniref:chromate transporter n=1 Tax=Geobacillus stearothermophilus TaxID=1422 RepID=UPI002E2336B1|nr:chromate transporter [Geobacillus stearothermophilus]MED3769303.1 chromate transporter [Geobacillus stearothermophilus]MED3773136.1 chromate transporter [Geobacillus stearothermophilus]MED3784144.1 chromate transporter [Geobacillus stearothermophilus]